MSANTLQLEARVHQDLSHFLVVGQEDLIGVMEESRIVHILVVTTMGLTAKAQCLMVDLKATKLTQGDHKPGEVPGPISSIPVKTSQLFYNKYCVVIINRSFLIESVRQHFYDK